MGLRPSLAELIGEYECFEVIRRESVVGN